ncbi:hypothetical protein PTTG_05843 [Puccinia triticina 1-1 BBBD Race 1]|uniref:Uncharacterized protein n=2 Tax=Puccinia triticina TaxID=208348 RepID=A0A180GAF5_PUCT1|nr:uncharacterized protein PtA15_6A405 [Puccinia triticina]OAV89604.1 hypothetical protein PTTG_05843 [Puccinia triticina 1-1 BBBD Race 1]WAQ85776.1 hypothetical protein PtA15_6A405 [Puccinia triticina]WAR55653.1 hypothetical protein PtB15_6B396 [Puccinia triticina]
MLAQRNTFFLALAFASSTLLFSVQALALPLSSQAEGIQSTYLKRNVNATIITMADPKLAATTGTPLVQRDIPPQAVKLMETAIKFIKRDSLEQRDIPPQAVKMFETVGKLIKRDTLEQRDIPPPAMKLIETAVKFIKRDTLEQRDIPAPLMKTVDQVGVRIP